MDGGHHVQGGGEGKDPVGDLPLHDHLVDDIFRCDWPDSRVAIIGGRKPKCAVLGLNLEAFRVLSMNWFNFNPLNLTHTIIRVDNPIIN